MNLAKLFETQRVLDARIEKEHPRVEGEDRLAKKILALQVELGECANEWRGFKFWSAYQKPKNIIHTTQGATTDNAVYYQCSEEECGERFNKNDERLNDLFGKNDEDCPVCEDGLLYAFRKKNPLLEEYVDCLHFILSIGLEYELKQSDFAYLGSELNETIIEQFIMLNVVLTETFYTPKMHIEPEFRQLIELFIGLGEMLGFTWEQVEQAYYEKNEINHARQEAGY
ncbi:dUTP diphosphatase [Psychrobacillus sp. FSL K6-1415]|uniref:dUTP diphosphatase n=1 Tax=Psychrobacillus sp. FSL K6-1415 TaxID=2921544 RepID=UPI0030F74E62